MSRHDTFITVGFDMHFDLRSFTDITEIHRLMGIFSDMTDNERDVYSPPDIPLAYGFSIRAEYTFGRTRRNLAVSYLDDKHCEERRLYMPVWDHANNLYTSLEELERICRDNEDDYTYVTETWAYPDTENPEWRDFLKYLQQDAGVSGYRHDMYPYHLCELSGFTDDPWGRESTKTFTQARNYYVDLRDRILERPESFVDDYTEYVLG